MDKPKSRRSRGRPSLKQVADIEKELLDVALNAFLKYGYGGTSMAMIVKTAGVSKTTLYSRYSSKEELFLAVIHRMFEASRFVANVDGDQAALGLQAALKAYAVRMLEVGMNDIVMGMDRLIYSEAHRFPEVAAASSDLYSRMHAALRDLIAKSAEHDGISCPDPAGLADLLMALNRGYHTKAAVTNHKLTKAEMEAWAERSVALLLKSLD